MLIKVFGEKIIPIAILLILVGCNSYKYQSSSFKVTESKQGILVEENGEKILLYQKEIKSLDGLYSRNNYIHPLYNLDGEILTEDFPEDHPHHRGIFWAWHHVSVNDTIISDTWSLINYDCNLQEATSTTDSSGAVINIIALWSSPVFLEGTPYLKEQTKIKISSKSENIRIIDFEISLLALINGLKIGGSDDLKEYGGFSARIQTPSDMIFTSDLGQILPQETQINAGSWIDISATFGNGNHVSGITLLSHPNLPACPQSWILRQQRSMQNVVYPGRKPVLLSTEIPTLLNYRMIIHNGNADIKMISKWKDEYK